MENNLIVILYIDDQIENNLSSFLRLKCKEDENLKYMEYKFKSDAGIDSLVDSVEVKDSDIILIDNLLYENSTAKRRDTGEELVPLLQYGYPFKKLLIMTREGNPIDDGMIYVKKFDDSKNRSRENDDIPAKSYKYYENDLWNSYISYFIRQIKSERIQLEKFKNMEPSKSISELTKERVLNTFSGNSTYKSLTSADVSKLVARINNLIKKVKK